MLISNNRMDILTIWEEGSDLEVAKVGAADPEEEDVDLRMECVDLRDSNVTINRMPKEMTKTSQPSIAKIWLMIWWASWILIKCSKEMIKILTKTTKLSKSKSVKTLRTWPDNLWVTSSMAAEVNLTSSTTPRQNGRWTKPSLSILIRTPTPATQVRPSSLKLKSRMTLTLPGRRANI